MDLNWFPYMHGFWIFPLLCLALMVIMMIAGSRMCFRVERRGQSHNASETPQQILERRYASGEIVKEQYDEVRRDLER